MFGLKSKKPKTYIRICYGKGTKAQVYGRGEIPIKEQWVIKKSIQFFEDPEPCYIHRGAVVMRLNEEVMKVLEHCVEVDPICAEKIPKEVLEYIDLEEIVSFGVIIK